MTSQVIGCAKQLGVADFFEQRLKGAHLGLGEVAEGAAGAVFDEGVEGGEEIETGGGDEAVDLAAVGGGAFAADEVFGFEAVNEAGDAGGLLNEAFRDGESGQAGVAGATEDAEDVVLLFGEAVGGEDGVLEAVDMVGRFEQGDDGFFFEGREGAGLADFRENARSSGHVKRLTDNS